MKRLSYSRKISYAAAGLSLFALVIIVPIATRAEDEQAEHHDERFTVDAALDLGTLGPAGKTMFARGEALVVDGTLYPGGTLPSGTNAGNDPNAPGGIGKIRCRATFLTASTDMTSAFATFVSELYSLPDDMTNLLADGFGPNFGFTARRIVSGGTGRFRGMVGEIEETEIGFNSTGGCNLHIVFKLRKVEREHHER
jgi:hypothetical protein